MATFAELGLFADDEPQSPESTQSWESLGLFADTEQEAQQKGGVLDFFRVLAGPSRGPLTVPGEDEGFEDARERAFATMGVEHERPEAPIVSDADLDVSDRIARRQLQRELNPEGGEARAAEIDQTLKATVDAREAASEAEQEQLGEEITVFGTPLNDTILGKDSSLGDTLSMPLRRGFAATATVGATIQNATRRVFGYTAAAEETRNALNVLSRYNQKVDEDSLLGRAMGPIAGNIQESLVQGTLAAPGGLVTVAGMFGLDQMDRAMTEASNQGLNGYEQATTGVVNFLIGGGLTYGFGAAAKKLGLDPSDGLYPAYARAATEAAKQTGATRIAASALINSGEEGIQEALTAWEEVRSGVNPNGLDDVWNRVLQAAGTGAISGVVSPSVGALKDNLSSARDATTKFQDQAPDIVSAVDDVQKQFGAEVDLADKSPEYRAAYAAESDALTRMQRDIELNNPTGESREQVADRKAAAAYVRETLDGLPAEDRAAAEASLAKEEAEIAAAEAYFSDLDTRMTGRGEQGARAFLEAEAQNTLGRVGSTPSVDDTLDTTVTLSEGGYVLPPRHQTLVRDTVAGGISGLIAGGAAGFPLAGGLAGAIMGAAANASPRYNMTRTLTDTLVASAQGLPEAVRAKALDVASEMSRKGKRAAAIEQEYLGRLAPERTKVFEALTPGAEVGASKQTVQQIARLGQQAREEAGHVTTDSGVRAGKYAVTAYLEGTKPLSTATPEMRAWVEAQREAHQAMAAVSTDELKIRQHTPIARREARRAELSALPKDELQQLHAELFPDRDVPSSDEALLTAVTNTRFFTPFPEGKVALRIPTPKLREILSKGPAHELYAPLMESISKANGIDIETATAAMNPLQGERNAAKIVSEVPRIFEWFPDYIEGPRGKENLLERDPFNYSRSVFDSFASSAARVREFGQDILQDDGVGELAKLRDQAVAAGLPADVVGHTHDAIAGLGPEKGVEMMDAMGPVDANGLINKTTNFLRAQMLSGSFIAQIPDLLSVHFTHGGAGRARVALQAMLPRALTTAEYRDAVVHAERIGAYVKDYADWTYKTDAHIESLARVYGNSALHLTRKAWDAEARAAGVLGYRVAEDLRHGRGTESDRHLLEDMAGYTPEQADRLIRRDGTTLGDYHEAARRIASTVSTTNLTPNVSKTAIQASPLWQNLMWFSAYPLYRAKTTARKVDRLVRDTQGFFRQPSVDSAAKAAAGIKEFARYAGYTTAGGAVQIALRNMLFNFGVDEGLGVTWEEATEDPLTFAGEAFRASMMGPILDSLIWSAQRDGQFDVGAVSPVVSVMSEVGDAINPNTQNWAYQDKTPAERVQTLLSRYAAPRRLLQAGERLTEIDALAPLLYPIGLGTEDEEFRVSRRRFYDFLGEKGKGRVSFVASAEESPEDKQFRRHMKRFMDQMDNEEDSPERGAKMQQHLFAALGVEGKDRAAMTASLRARRMLPRIPQEYRGEFAQQYPDDYRRISAFDSLLDSWAEYLKD